MEIISALLCPNLNGTRRSGNTTRQIDFTIAKLFEGYEVLLVDHCYITCHTIEDKGDKIKYSRHLIDGVLQRLYTEHKLPEDKVEIKKTKNGVSIHLKL